MPPLRPSRNQPSRRLPLLLCVVLWLCTAALVQAEDRWFRYPAVSPDGSQIAFSYRGDLWLVAAEGGIARPLTSHEGYESVPVWSPDSRSLAFASDRHGQLDVFLMPASGGPATRLTFHSRDDLPESFTPDGQRILFTSARQDLPAALIGNSNQPELYSIGVAGGRPVLELTTPAEAATYSPDGDWVAYHDRKGYENQWRKHHTSSVTRDLWLWQPATGKHQQLTDFAGEDRHPVWSADGTELSFLSERGGSFNIWRMAIDQPNAAHPVTDQGPHPVRFLSSASDGTLVYGYHGQIWRLPSGGKARQVAIELQADTRHNLVRRLQERDGATEFAISPHSDEVAFVLRGEIFAASVEYGTTRRLTQTPEQERSLTWAPDGRSLYFAGERNGSWNLYQLSLARDDEERFFESTIVEETTILATDDETFQPQISPDGKQLAYLHNRDELRVFDLETGSSKTVIPAEHNYSYTDGDIEFQWSPDSRWLAATYFGYRRWISEIALVEVATLELTNVSDSGYDEAQPKWSDDGKALLFLSDRNGRRSHGSWGSDDDIFAFYVDRQAFDRARLSVEEFERLRKKQEDEQEGDGKKKKKKKDKDKPVEPIEVEPDGREHRIHRMTLHSSPIADFVLSDDGETVVYLAQVEDRWDLWLAEVRSRETRRLLAMGDEQPGDLALAEDGETLVVRSGDGKLLKIDASSLFERGNGKKKKSNGGGNSLKPQPIAYRAELALDQIAEWQYLFEHVWRQVKRKFYRQDLHGADWPALKAEYSRFLTDLRHGRDFAELLSEMLGELNASHTGAGYRERRPDADQTASLGLIFDPAHRGDGLRVVEVLPRGPADQANSRIAAGAVLTHIDGHELTAETNPWPLLNRKAGQRVRLTLASGSGSDTGASWEEVVEPISRRDEYWLLYDRWQRRLVDLTEQASGGRVGYVHVHSMNDASFRRFFREALGRNSDKEALVVDTRWNGGGWLHDDLVSFLQGQRYMTVVPRDKEPHSLGGEPLQRWDRPVAVLQNEANYSDGHIFPFAFKEFGLGPLVGMPVAGTGTAVWWETLIDPALVFGIPQVGLQTIDGEYLENLQLEPDVKVANDPESLAAGEDRQLIKAVEVLLESLVD